MDVARVGEREQVERIDGKCEVLSNVKVNRRSVLSRQGRV